jgi:hypothetical protein
MPINVKIVDKCAVAAAHSSALTEKAYRECKVYGMGSRPRLSRKTA